MLVCPYWLFLIIIAENFVPHNSKFNVAQSISIDTANIKLFLKMQTFFYSKGKIFCLFSR